MAEVVIISGAGAYADPWHPFPATSERVRSVITDLGHRVTVSDRVQETLLALGPASLVVINIGNPDPAPDVATTAAIETALRQHLARGGGLLGLHVSATSFPTMSGWPEILGGHWVRGTSMHPPLDRARIRLRTGAHPVAGSDEVIEVTDERYCRLQLREDVTVIGEHVHEGRTEPMIWARTAGPGRVVYDGLGHDERSFDSAGHRVLLGRAVGWLLATGAEPG